MRREHDSPCAQRSSRPGLPARVQIYEVGPRDGLQNEDDGRAHRRPRPSSFPGWLPPVSAPSRPPALSHPKWVPQLGDAEDLFPDCPSGEQASGIRSWSPICAGWSGPRPRASREIAVFASATETFARRNLNRTMDESLAMFAPVITAARQDGMWVRAYISMCFGDPWEGDVPSRRWSPSPISSWPWGPSSSASGTPSASPPPGMSRT